MAYKIPFVFCSEGQKLLKRRERNYNLSNTSLNTQAFNV